jgi:hypothetical protein
MMNTRWNKKFDDCVRNRFFGLYFSIFNDEEILQLKYCYSRYWIIDHKQDIYPIQCKA